MHALPKKPHPFAQRLGAAESRSVGGAFPSALAMCLLIIVFSKESKLQAARVRTAHFERKARNIARQGGGARERDLVERRAPRRSFSLVLAKQRARRTGTKATRAGPQGAATFQAGSVGAFLSRAGRKPTSREKEEGRRPQKPSFIVLGPSSSSLRTLQYSVAIVLGV